MSEMIIIEGGITAPVGFTASGINAGIKKSNLDLAVISSDRACTAAAVFTSNKVQGATVKLCRELIENETARGLVVNSGNANACNGPAGMTDARRMGSVTAGLLGVAVEEVFVCSTGTIGRPLPMDKIQTGIASAVDQLSDSGGADAAAAIMTTDTVPKQVAYEIEVDGRKVRIGGIAKGAGMIEPNMATMLSFITTDASVEKKALRECLVSAVNESFNRISVDGDQSCNDTVLILANGASGAARLDVNHPGWPLFVEAVKKLTLELAWMIVRDGEGATKFVTLKVRGAETVADAEKAARCIANSLLVKTSWYGCDPNWGRVIDAAGYSGAELVEERVDIWYDELCSVKNGCPASDTDLADLEEVLRKDSFTLTVDLNIGSAESIIYTCDCSEEYVRINSEYTT